MEQHQLSAAFPAMSAMELADLTNDIRHNGQRYPIVILDGMILDGWHRYQACLTLGIEPTSILLADGLDPVVFVQSVNLKRRNLDASQRAAAVTACNAWARAGNQPKGEVAAPLATVAEMAKTAGVSERTIQQAKTAHAAGLGDAVRDGLVTVERAAEIAKLPEAERQAAVIAPKTKPERKPRVPSLPVPAGEIERLNAVIADQVAEIKELAQALDVADQNLRETAEQLRRMTRSFHLAQDRYNQLKRKVA